MNNSPVKKYPTSFKVLGILTLAMFVVGVIAPTPWDGIMKFLGLLLGLAAMAVIALSGRNKKG